ncbi:MAG: serine/threonine-protein kinase [Rudaea sp.]
MSTVLRLRELFEAAVELHGKAREEFLTRECSGDQALRDDVEALLKCDANADDPLARSVAAQIDERDGAAQVPVGRVIGSYRILRELGSGGMASVYLAERADREYENKVAIKLIRGFPTAQALEHLRRERQVLAGLGHPHIARLLDGGTTSDGQPYLVMDYVQGLPLQQWFAQRQPSLELRLRVFQQLCLAVHHAHQNLIVHRDLKPANVMVRDDDTPVLLDFGIAKLVAPDPDGELATVVHAFTRDYASPEQLAGGSVTTASDIYGLGLLLYELLCGKPYRNAAGTSEWRTSRPARIAGEAAREWVRAGAAQIDGDLDNIVRRSVAEEPDRRYSSAAAMALEIDRYFAGLPLEAGPDLWRYRVAKFVSRHRLGVASSILAVLCVIGAATWLAVERNRAMQAQVQARREAETADRVTEFVLQLFRNADPQVTRGQDVTARELVDRGSRTLDTGLAGQPQVRARLLEALGEIYTSIGVPRESVKLLREAVALLRRPDADPLRLARALNELCRADTQSSDYAEGLQACQEALTLRHARLDPGAAELGHSHDALGVVEQELGNFADAEQNYRRALAIFSAAGPEHRGDVASTHHDLGYLAAHRGDYATALREYRIALASKRALYGEAHPLTLNSLDGVAQSEAALGDLGAARRDFAAALKLRVAVHGAQSMPVARAHNNLASVMQDMGDYAGSQTHYTAALKIEKALQPPDSMDVAYTANNLATLFEDRGDPEAALPLFEKSLQIRETKFKPPHPALARAQHNLARCLLMMGNSTDARTHLDAALTARRALLPATDTQRFDSELLLAQWQLVAGQLDQAAAALARLVAPTGPGNYRRRALLADIRAQLHAAQGDGSGARRDEQRALDELRSKLPVNHPLCARASARLAWYAHALRDDAAARKLLEQALPILHQTLVMQSVDRIKADELAIALGIGKSAKHYTSAAGR